MSTFNALPSPPDLVLRIGFAGNRKLPADVHRLAGALDAVLSAASKELRAVLPSPSDDNRPDKITRFYSKQPPRLRLVTGLAEGADEEAALALDRLGAIENLPAAPAPAVIPELAAILPFDLDTYTQSREQAFRPTFEARCAQCAYVLCLDGLYEPSRDGEPQINTRRRRRAYRAQGATLIRHVDLLVAALDLRAEGKAGGTLETIDAALDFGLPVVLIDLGKDAAIWLIEPGAELHTVLEELHTDLEKAPAAAPPPWEGQLQRWICRIVADPDFPRKPVHADDAAAVGSVPFELRQNARLRGQRAVAEYFGNADCPPWCLVGEKSQRLVGLRERIWVAFEKWFRRPLAGSMVDAKLEPFAAYRDRATSLNYHYSGLYRGTFVLNYALAVAAVLLATLSLVLIGYFAAHHAYHLGVAVGGKEHAGDSGGFTASVGVLAALALAKIGLLYWIKWNTERSREEDWSDRAIDFRYLAERLRSMYYLPLVGSFQPPMVTAPKYASRHVRQSGIDWLFQAMVRSISPAQMASVRRSSPTNPAGTPILTVEAVSRLGTIREKWIGKPCNPKAPEDHPGVGQMYYHQRNSDTLRRMYERLDALVRDFNQVVIWVVIVDLVVCLSGVDPTHAWTPWLVFLAAVLPAAVASFNGLRFQSECQRMADRSGMMVDLLADRSEEAEALLTAVRKARKQTDTDLGSYNVEALKLTEDVARDLSEEVGEWSVLYSKDLAEP